MEEKAIDYNDLPMHKIRSLAKERGISVKNTDTKKIIVSMLETGKTTHEPKETKRMDNIEDTANKKCIPLLPKNFDSKISHLLARGLKYEIDEENNCINFSPVDPYSNNIIPTCVNIDSIERHIYKAAEDAFTRGNAMEIDDRNNVQALRIDEEKREKERMKREIEIKLKAEMLSDGH